MPIRVTHVVDEHTPTDALRQLALLQAIPADRVEQRIVTVGPRPVLLDALCGSGTGRTRAGTQIGRCAKLQLNPLNHGWEVFAGHPPHVLHAWGASAGTIVRNVRPAGTPVVLTLTDPAEIGDVCRWWPLEADVGSHRQGTVVCASQFVLDRIVAFGVPRAAAAWIRPGVDLHERPQPRPPLRRADLDLPDDARVLLTASPPTRAGGQFFAVWAAAILFQVWPHVRLIVPGRSRERDRIRRLIDSIYCPQIYHLVEDTPTPADLLALADLLVAPAVADVPTAWVAAAMAAGVPVVASTVPSLAEIVRDEQTGFTCPPAEPHSLAIRIRQAVEDPQRLQRCVAAARQWAAAECHPDRCRHAHAALYDRLAARPDAPLAVESHSR